ncbi:MAG: nucleoside deaminase [Mesorhizobium sp.]|uniref:nucleoside deaminase n=1 Tax=Mesorhizobium sp. TaxID=1871066 RepID=UPI001AD38F57|nr:nucleoside deaminase [Mesorhizobium sp.]
MIAGAGSQTDEFYMSVAIAQARRAMRLKNPPIGAVVVIGDKLVSKAYNSNTSGRTWLGHAEQTAMRRAATHLRFAGEVSKERRVLYSTLQPCLMCFSTAIFCRIDHIVFGAADPHCGHSNLDITTTPDWYRRRLPGATGGILAAECASLLDSYIPTPPFEAVEDR